MNKFDLPSFWSGLFVGILILMTWILMSRVFGDYYTITVPEICNYAEDMCHAEYDSNGWHIVEGERK